MQPRCRLVEDVKRPPRAAPAEFLRQLDALGFAARKCRRWLPEFDVIQPDIVQGFQHRVNFGDVLEVRDRLPDFHLQHVVNRLAAILHLQRFVVETLPAADRARHPNIGEEVHFQFVRAIAFARFATPTGPVETESPGLIPAHLRLGHLRVQRTDLVEHLDIRCGV